MTTIDHIVAIAREIAPGSNPTAASTFDALGFDSLDCIDFTAAVEDAFDVEIGCGERISFDSLADVAALVDSRVVARLPLAA